MWGAGLTEHIVRVRLTLVNASRGEDLRTFTFVQMSQRCIGVARWLVPCRPDRLDDNINGDRSGWFNYWSESSRLLRRGDKYAIRVRGATFTGVGGLANASTRLTIKHMHGLIGWQVAMDRRPSCQLVILWVIIAVLAFLALITIVYMLIPRPEDVGRIPVETIRQASPL